MKKSIIGLALLFTLGAWALPTNVQAIYYPDAGNAPSGGGAPMCYGYEYFLNGVEIAGYANYTPWVVGQNCEDGHGLYMVWVKDHMVERYEW